MYSIVAVIYGSPLTEKVLDVLDDLGLEPGDAGYTTMYSGSSDITPGYIGVELDGFDECDDHLLVSKLKLTPTAKHISDVKTLFDTLHDKVKKVALPLDVYFIFSTS